MKAVNTMYNWWIVLLVISILQGCFPIVFNLSIIEAIPVMVCSGLTFLAAVVVKTAGVCMSIYLESLRDKAAAIAAPADEVIPGVEAFAKHLASSSPAGLNAEQVMFSRAVEIAGFKKQLPEHMQDGFEAKLQVALSAWRKN